jgi:hypothetical protein
MAKGKRSNSPKKSRRGGKRSPKKSKMGVQKKISKGEAEPAQLHEPTELDECDLPNEADEQQELPKMANEVLVPDVSSAKADLVQFFWESLEEDSRAGLMSLLQNPDHLFFFGKVAAEIAKSGKFTNEVESNLAMVWKADEAWIRSFLAGEVELPKPEEPAAPEEPMEQAEIVEEIIDEAKNVEEVVETAEVELDGSTKEESFIEEAVVEAPVVEEKPEADIAMEDVPETAVEAEIPIANADAEGFHVPESMEELVSESALNKENTADAIAEAVKTVSSKLGEQSADPAPLEGLAPKDLNVVEPVGLA